MSVFDFARATWDYALAWARYEPRREEGLTTTEVAVITFLLVGAAIVVMGIIYSAARDNANNIPVPDAPS